MNIISKMGTSHSTAKDKVTDPTSPTIQSSSRSNRPNLPPSLSTNALSGPGAPDLSGAGLSEGTLKRQSLECLVAVLRSLVVWGTQVGKGVADAVINPVTRPRPIEDPKFESGLADPALDKSSVSLGAELSRTATPDLNDDPGKFESAKQKKTTLLDGIRKFNFKPKRVCCLTLDCAVSATLDVIYTNRAYNFYLRRVSFRQEHPKTLHCSFCTLMV